MCGLFGFVGEELDTNVVQQIAQEAGRRGPHAYGFAWEEGVIRDVGCMSDHLDRLSAIDGGWFIGHARLATYGTYLIPEYNQPLIAEKTVVAHNGNIYDYQNIIEELEWTPKTQIDTEAILAMLLRYRDWPYILGRQADRSPQAALIRHKDSMYTVRYGHPLYALEIGQGTYFCSRPFDARCTMVATGTRKVS